GNSNVELSAVQSCPVVVAGGPFEQRRQIPFEKAAEHLGTIHRNLDGLAKVDDVWRDEQCKVSYAARRGAEPVAEPLDVHSTTWNLTPPREDVHLRSAVAEDVHVLERLRRGPSCSELVDHEPAHTIESIYPIRFPREPLWMRRPRVCVHEHLI